MQIFAIFLNFYIILSCLLRYNDLLWHLMYASSINNPVHHVRPITKKTWRITLFQHDFYYHGFLRSIPILCVLLRKFLSRTDVLRCSPRCRKTPLSRYGSLRFALTSWDYQLRSITVPKVNAVAFRLVLFLPKFKALVSFLHASNLTKISLLDPCYFTRIFQFCSVFCTNLRNQIN